MKRRYFVKKLAAFMTMLLILCGGSPAFALVDIEGRYWFSDIDGKISVANGGTAGTELDLVRDLGMDDENFIDARITLELGSHRLRYGFTPLKWEGRNTFTAPVDFGDVTFPATVVDSEIRMDYHRLGYQYNIIDTLDNHLGVIFEIKYFDGKASLKAPTVPLDETETFTAPIPTIGISAQAALPFLLSVGGEVTGISFGSKAYLVDGEASINIKPAPFVVISGGYRIFKLHAEHDSDLADLTVKGPFVMLRADF